MHNVHIVIPVRDVRVLTENICRQLMQQSGWNRCWIMDNGSEDDTPAYLEQLTNTNPKFVSRDAKGLNIHQMWQTGFDVAVMSGATHVAFLNNDIIMVPDTIEWMRKVIDHDPSFWLSYPDYEWRVNDPRHKPNGEFRITWGSYRHGGMSGFCYMLKVAAMTWAPLIDPGLKFWYGDDDLAYEIAKRGGQQVRVSNLALDHIGQATTKVHHKMYDLIPADKAFFIEKWFDFAKETYDYWEE